MCCQGWLEGNVNGHAFYAGAPCHFVPCTGCSIYKDRPAEPCKSYKCAWLDDEGFLPEWFKPDVSKILCTWRKTSEGITYLDVEECGEQIDAIHLNWLFMAHIKAGFNLRYKVKGGLNFIGSPDFVQSIQANPTQK